jgi:hypothetical protein
MASLHVFIAGFGAPHVEEKKRILRNNMAVIDSTAQWSRVKYTICCYDETDFMEWWPDSRVHIVREKGIVGQFMKRHLLPDTESTAYDYLLLLLDDVELIPGTVNMTEMIQWLNELSMDVVSPCMTTDSKIQFQYMRQSVETGRILRITSVLEFFCYFTTPAWYRRYYPLIEAEMNPWGWTLDMMLYKRFGFRVGVFNHMRMRHWYKGESYGLRPDADPMKGSRFVLEKWGVTAEELATQPAVRYVVIGGPTS